MIKSTIISITAMLLAFGPAAARVDPALPSQAIQPMVTSEDGGRAETKDVHEPPAPPPSRPTQPSTCATGESTKDDKAVPCAPEPNNLRGQADVPEVRPFRQFNSQRFAP